MRTVTSLSDRTTHIILGSLLGDGSLRIAKHYRNARFAFRHSATQRDYFAWKVRMLSDISSPHSVHEQRETSGFGIGTVKLHYESHALPVLTELHHQTHDRGTLRIERSWLNTMSPLSLAVWWFDDGSLITNTRRGVFCTDGFTRTAVQRLAQYLQTVWNVRTVVGAVGEKRAGHRPQCYRLWIRSSEELQRFLKVILPYTPVESMLPKVLLCYRDPELQQRWSSEVIARTHFSEQTVQRYVHEKRRRWKQFRA